MRFASGQTRRQILCLVCTVTAAGAAGCTDGGSSQSNEGGDGGGSVPQAYETATSIDGIKRNPDQVQSKEGVQYQTQPEGDERCSNCTYYIEDKNGDGAGACSIVEGKIQPNAWCAAYQRSE